MATCGFFASLALPAAAARRLELALAQVLPRSPLCAPARATMAAAAHAARRAPVVRQSRVHPLLQEDILLHVFNYLRPVPHLCDVALVCTTWAHVAATPSLWRRVVVPNALSSCAPSCATSVKKRRLCSTRRAPNVRRLLRLIVRRAGVQLHTLLLDRFVTLHRESAALLDDSDINFVATSCATSLQRFAVSPRNRVKADGYLLLCRTCPNLRQLHIIHCVNLQCSHLASIAKACPLLEDISIERCPQIRARSLSTNLAALSNTLKRIHISNMSISSLPLAPFAFNFPSLRHFIVENNLQLQVTGMPPRDPQNLMFPSLRSLHVSRISIFPLSWLQQILFHCTQLNSLQASALDCHLNPSCLLVQLPALERLSFADHDLHDTTWHHIVAQLCNTLQYCDLSRNRRLTCSLQSHHQQSPSLFPKLHSLYLSETAVTDETVKTILRLAPNLSTLNTDACRGVKDRAFRRDPIRLSKALSAKTPSQPTATRPL